MIISEIIFDITKNRRADPNQKILISCDNISCDKEYIISLSSQKKCFKKYDRDLCRGCQQKEQYKNGLREGQSKKAGEGYSKKYIGKSYEYIYKSSKKADEIRKKHSLNAMGDKNPMFGKNYHTTALKRWSSSNKGKKFEEIYEYNKAKEFKKQISKNTSGSGNPMYGKPSPIGSGNGWSGWYKGWYFRSLRELSYMINVIERFKFDWKPGENKKYMVKYIDYKGIQKNYYSDFIIDEKYMVEIKPKKLHNSNNVIRKKYAAIKFCESIGLKYKLIDPIKTLSYNDIKILIKNKEIKFIDRYKEKWKLWKDRN